MKKNNPTILVVDDDTNDLFFIGSAFKAAGIIAKIQTAASGQEAIAYLKGEGIYSNRHLYGYPDFVITDLKMPGVDGFDVLDCLRHAPGPAMTPAIILSGSLDNDDIRKAYLLGASSYHVKPSAPLALRALVKALYDYWSLCEFPTVSDAGVAVEKGSHKLGERFSLREGNSKMWRARKEADAAR